MGLVWVMVMATESSWRNKDFLGRPFGGWENEIPRDKKPSPLFCMFREEDCCVSDLQKSFILGWGWVQTLPSSYPQECLARVAAVFWWDQVGILCDFRVHGPSPRSKHWGIISKVPQCWTFCCGKHSLSLFMDEKIGYCSWGNGGWFWMVS